LHSLPLVVRWSHLVSLESFQTLLASLLAQDDEGLAILIECQVLLQEDAVWMGWGRAGGEQQQETIAAASPERQTEQRVAARRQ
jgi:hypothetical protein